MRILCNFAMSADGKIASPDRSHISLGSAEDKRRMSLLRRQADAVLVGGASFRACPEAMIEAPSHLLDSPTRQVPIWNIVLTKSLNLPLDAPAFSDARVRPLVITEGGSAPRHPWGDRVEVIALPEVSPRAVIDILSTRGVQTLLLESGGDVTSQFLHAGLIDELYLTITPLVLAGRDAPTPAGGAAFPPASAPRLTLLEATVRGSEVFLHYRVIPSPSPPAGSAAAPPRTP
jgi:5-amino-6-(5-phosphoribosylamino)uracil reductase